MSSLKAMQYFVQVAELGSFSKAADALHLTQPAVSRQVRKLEAELGLPLLFQKGRGIAPTEAGQILMARARELEKEASRIFEDVRASANRPAGPLAIGVPTSIGSVLLPPVVKTFVEKFPEVKLHILEGYSGYLEDWLQAGRIDLALIWGRPRTSSVIFTPLLAVKLCLIAPPASASSRGKIPETELGPTCTIEEILRLPLILPALPHPLRQLAENAAAKAGVSLNVHMEVDSLPLAGEMVKLGLGYTLMIHPSLQARFGQDNLRCIPISSPDILWVLSSATLKGTRNSPAMREFMDRIDATLKAFVSKESLIDVAVLMPSAT